MRHVETVESRRYFAGGVDPAYGSALGALFDAPGDDPVVYDSTVDARGRAVIVGSTRPVYADPDAWQGAEFFVARLTADGRPDPAFGVNGVNRGTARGMRAATDVVADFDSYKVLLDDGTGTRDVRVGYFGGDGFLDAAVANRGTRATRFARTLDNVLLDNVLVGEADLPGRVLSIAAQRLDGRAWGGSAEGIVVLSPVNTSAGEGEEVVRNSVRFAAASPTLFDAFESVYVGVYQQQVSNFNQYEGLGLDLLRVDGTGAVDDAERSVTEDVDNEGNYRNGDDHGGTLVVTPGGTPIAAVYAERVAGAADDVLVRTVTENDVDEGPLDLADYAFGAPVRLRDLAPGFSIERVEDGSAARADGGKLVLAGTVAQGAARVPALLRLDADLTLDATFGDGGVLALPTRAAGPATAAGGVVALADGSAVALTTRASDGGDALGSSAARAGAGAVAFRVLPDDRPIARLVTTRRDGGNQRVVVRWSGAAGVDRATLGNNDVRAAAEGVAVNARLVNAVEDADGVVTATYRFARGPLQVGQAYPVRALSNRVFADNGVGSRGDTLFTLTI